MNKIRKVVCIFISLIVILLELCGCETNGMVASDFQKYARKKYAMKAKVKGVDQGMWDVLGSSRDECLLYPINNPSKKFLMTRDHHTMGIANECTDGYFNNLVQSLIEERIKGIMGDRFKDFKYCFSISSYYCEKFKNENKNMSFNLDDVLNNKDEIDIDTYVLVDSGEKFDKTQAAERVYQFMNELRNSNLVNRDINMVSMSLSFYFVNSHTFNKTKPEIIQNEESEDAKQNRRLQGDKEETGDYDQKEAKAQAKIYKETHYYDKAVCDIYKDNTVDEILNDFKSVEDPKKGM
ncbi:MULTISPECIES: hypothetical protein [Clostridium]|uniref:hypothetical protein n=1 Tax=Clostridium TaxID=1485 RepID=UPI00082453B6|nr:MULTISPECIES: hypothetical protein [Clostridium]PJI09601.1 hypothetical protein CUB90_17765 [Clostridium sp. CT7]